MPEEYRHPPESDLDKTDELPILKDVVFDFDVGDDAVPLDRTAVLQSPPSLAESVRSVEERIPRQQAEFEALTRAYERSRDAELASVERASALAADLAAARTALESEQTWFGMIVAMIQVQLPLFVIPVLAVMQRCDPSLVRAAKTLGADPVTAASR